MIQTIWTQGLTPVWDHRNKAVHAIEEKNQKSREYLNLNFTLWHLYGKAHALCTD